MELKTLFQRIAAAIREKEGSTGSIRAAAFPMRLPDIMNRGVTARRTDFPVQS